MRFHSVKAGDAGYAIYFPETSTIIKGSENEINVLNMIVAGKSCAELEKEGYVLGEETYLAYKCWATALITVCRKETEIICLSW